MRRGRPGIGGWRSENPRPFRPRNSRSAHFRPPRGFGLLEPPRYLNPGPRFQRPPGFITHQVQQGINENHDILENHERNNFRQFPHTQPRHQNRDYSHPRPSIPPFSPQKHPYSGHNNIHQTHSASYEGLTQIYGSHVNNMGDIDDRHTGNVTHNREHSFQRHKTWTNPAIGKGDYYNNDCSPKKHYKHSEGNEKSKLPSENFTGHRPPASDHYGSSNTTINNKTFNRSVDDTVDLIRERLKCRNDNQEQPSHELVSQHDTDERTANRSKNDDNVQEEQASKKRASRPTQIKSNCDKIKTNIVHQLFKMDKNKIHKLMDNPSSSSKFEYAISSLITESQNSLNKHLRSVAEKSLKNPSDSYINDENNTIYEDTFMKQMQCILDPQDTFILEDIKPIVMAELNKVLQVDEYLQEERNDEDDANAYLHNDELDYIYDIESYSSDAQAYNYENRLYAEVNATETFDHPELSDTKVKMSEIPKNESSDIFESMSNKTMDQFQNCIERNELSERQVNRISSPGNDLIRRSSSESHINRRLSFGSERNARSVEEPKEDKNLFNQTSMPLFDTNADQLSDDEDPFAELDKQYHVEVDHSFIRSEDTSPYPAKTNSISGSPTIDKDKFGIKSNVPRISLTNLKLNSKAFDQNNKISFNSKTNSDKRNNNILNKPNDIVEILDSPNESVYMKELNNATPSKTQTSSVKKEFSPQSIEPNEGMINLKHNSITIKTETLSNKRKRSIDQKPSHRKEKRKKSESSQSDIDIFHSNIKSEVSPTATKNLVFSTVHNKEASVKTGGNSKNDLIKNSFSEKHVKRKRNSKQADTYKNSTSSKHSTAHPKVSSVTINTQLNKSDNKSKYKTIDIFMEQPKKMQTTHHAHRNTASLNKSSEENKAKSVKLNSSICHVATQAVVKLHSRDTQTTSGKHIKNRFVQTERKKMSNKSVQTDPVKFERIATKADGLERMKEIDLEIQVLLQEKFQQYNAMGLTVNNSSMETYGMAVLNVAPAVEVKSVAEPEVAEGDEIIEVAENIDLDSEDAIVDDFASIPVEELEQIAFETVQAEKNEKIKKRQKRLSINSQRSLSPMVTKSGRKVKPPNVSLIEEIITSDKPIEDLIELHELETPPAKFSKKKSTATKKKQSKKSKAKKAVSIYNYIKECSVVLSRIDISPYLKPHLLEDVVQSLPSLPQDIDLDELYSFDTTSMCSQQLDILPKNVELEEIISNDIQLQLDMLDVSEDIVIGDIDEDRSGDRLQKNRLELTFSEEVICDNSQSSCEEVFAQDVNQEEEVCKMYDYSTDDNLRKDSITVSGNVDAVLAIENIDNNFVAACLDGNVYHFSGDGQLLSTLRGSNLAVTCLTIAKEKHGTTVYTGSLDSRIRYYDLDTGLEKGPECNVLSPIQTMDRAWDTVFVGTRTGFVLQFEYRNNMLIPISTVKFSEQSILALRAIKEGPRKVLLVAARSEDVTVKDAQTGLLLRTLAGPRMTVYTLLFEDGKVYCGTSSHQVHVFDYATGGHVGAHEGGKGAVCLRASGGLLFAGCYDGCVYVFREAEPRPLAQLRGPNHMLLSLAIVGTKIIAGYKDRSLYIWKIPLSIMKEMIL